MGAVGRKTDSDNEVPCEVPIVVANVPEGTLGGMADLECVLW